MRALLPLLLIGCSPPGTEPADPRDTGADIQDTAPVVDTGDSSAETDTMPPPPIDQAAPAHVELATFALG